VTASDEKPEVPVEEIGEAVEIDEPSPGVEETVTESADPAPKKGFDAARLVAFVILPVLALLFGAAAGYLKWQDSSRRDAAAAAVAAVAAAKDSTIALLSYKPDTVDKDLGAARDRLTGSFLDAYTQLVNNVVIPGAKEKKISAQASVPAAASVSAKPDHAVVLLFVDQTVVVGADAPTNTASSVRVTLDKVGERWLISGFDPI
jgi:Mce-associated membrane protein